MMCQHSTFRMDEKRQAWVCVECGAIEIDDDDDDYHESQQCPQCRGTGQDWDFGECDYCDGMGYKWWE